MCAAGKTSLTGTPLAAGHVWFFGGTLVATYSGTFISRTSWPTSLSLCPGPYASAVSMKLTPSSTARRSASRLSASSAPTHRPLPMPQAPNPISETMSPVRPSRRYFIHRPPTHWRLSTARAGR